MNSVIYGVMSQTSGPDWVTVVGPTIIYSGTFTNPGSASSPIRVNYEDLGSGPQTAYSEGDHSGMTFMMTNDLGLIQEVVVFKEIVGGVDVLTVMIFNYDTPGQYEYFYGDIALLIE